MYTAIAAGMLIIAAALFWLLFEKAGDRDYTALYSHIDPAEIGSVISVLQQNGVPYRVEKGGYTVRVPRAIAPALRSALAIRGIPGEFEEASKPVSGAAPAEAKRRLEQRLEQSVQSMLGRALGAKNVVARVSVDLETGTLHQKEERYDPDDSAVESERKLQVGSPEMTAGGSGSAVPKRDVTVKYNVSRSLTDTDKPIFSIKRLSVGVLIDGKHAAGQETGAPAERLNLPRSEAELDLYTRLVKSAVGFDEKRGDTVSVVSVPFEDDAVEVGPTATMRQSNGPLVYAFFGVLGLLLLVGLLWLKKYRFQAVESSVSPSEALRSGRGREAERSGMEGNDAYRKLLRLVDENPGAVASLIRKWVKEGSRT